MRVSGRVREGFTSMDDKAWSTIVRASFTFHMSSELNGQLEAGAGEFAPPPPFFKQV